MITDKQKRFLRVMDKDKAEGQIPAVNPPIPQPPKVPAVPAAPKVPEEPKVVMKPRTPDKPRFKKLF